ncbi:cholesterol esterase [Irineochytrium annulatum]|nr:cholesterol esterase [Irineochytrium annulatum]
MQTRLFLAFAFLITEPILRIVFAIFPLRYLADVVRRAFQRPLRPSPPIIVPAAARRVPTSAEVEMKAEKQVEHLHNTEDFVRFWGFPFEPHYATTKDGYILALHRIPHSRSEQEVMMRNPGDRRGGGGRQRSNSASSVSSLSSIINNSRGNLNGNSSSHQNAPGGSYRGGSTSSTASPSARPVVLLWHGFMMCSEVWVCLPNPSQNLAFMLADAGYDVWLGNTRGNKYSCKHRSFKPTEEAFWDFSIDHLALHDLPDAVSYILKVTGAPTLSYIGFSQGTAQGFSALSMNRRLNRQINLFIAMAPVSKPQGENIYHLANANFEQGIDNKLVNALVNTSPEVIYLLFGRKAMVSSTLFWQSIFTPATFATIIDICTWGLFSWSSEWISCKSTVYRHLYSYTSVKMVVHWFQIMRNGRFQMYDENPTVIPNAAGGHLVPKFPTEHISTPIAMFYGGKDTLPDLGYILRESPNPVFCLQIEEYEHLTFLWGRGIEKTVFPGVLGLLNEYAEAWSDAEAMSPPPSHSELINGNQNTSYPTQSQTTRSRGVPWIPQSDIDLILELGQGRPTDAPLPGAASSVSGSMPNNGMAFTGRLSVAKLLKRAAAAAAAASGGTLKVRRVPSVGVPSSATSSTSVPSSIGRSVSAAGTVRAGSSASGAGGASGLSDPPSYSESESGDRDGTDRDRRVIERAVQAAVDGAKAEAVAAMSRRTSTGSVDGTAAVGRALSRQPSSGSVAGNGTGRRFSLSRPETHEEENTSSDDQRSERLFTQSQGRQGRKRVVGQFNQGD